MSTNIIGIDIGATKTHIGVVKDSRVIEEITFPTSATAPKNQIISEIIQGIEQVTTSGFSGIGIGVPGLVDEEKGIIYDLWNIPSWQEVHLKKALEDHFKIPVKITNDANTFVLGEKKYGKGKSFKNFVGITLGTGFGSGIIINHELYSGTLSSAGELADLPYLDKTIEDYCSGKFFQNKYGLEGRKVHEMAKAGDPEAFKIFNEYGNHLGNAIKLILNVLSPEAVFLGGSISQSFSFFEDSLREKIATFPFKRVIKNLEIAPSEISNVAILGSAALIKPQKQVKKVISF